MNQVWVIDKDKRPYTAVPVGVVKHKKAYHEKGGPRVFRETDSSPWWWKTEREVYEWLHQSAVDQVAWHQDNLERARTDLSRLSNILEDLD